MTLTPGRDHRVGQRRRPNTPVQTEDAKVTTNISNELIDQLPLVVGGAMRSVFDLVSTIPEAKGSGTNVVLGGGQGGAFGATLDGISVNTNRNADVVETAFLTPSVEAITEFSVETNGFKPEFGQAGGGAITFASKSGTNQFQGSLYNFLRNDALDEKGFFEPSEGHLPAEQLRRVAGRAGEAPAPLRRHRTRRSSLPPTKASGTTQASNAQTLSVPTPEMYDGDFSNWVDSQGRLHGDLRSGDDAAQSRTAPASSAIRSRATGFPPAGSATSRGSTSRWRERAVVPNRDGLVPGTLGYVVEQLPLSRRDDGRRRRTNSA